MRIEVLPGQSRVVKRMLPRSLLGRSLLIILVPLVITLGVALQIFYGTHLTIVSRRLSGAVAGEIASTIDAMARAATPEDRTFQLDRSWDNFELLARFEPGVTLAGGRPSPGPTWRFDVSGLVGDDLAESLRERVGKPFSTDWDSDPAAVLVRVQLPDGVMDVTVPRKRLYTGTLTLFVAWLVGTALLLFGLAALFMRNQVRAIRRLAVAAEAFGMGRDVGPIRPEGASEVRQAATAFNRMQERIRRFLTQRTEMLAGVSHDLRTPLTRLRLALAMFPPDVAAACDVAGMTGDLEEMDRMIGSYLAFARGEGTEQAQPTDLVAVLTEVANAARRSGGSVKLAAAGGLLLPLRQDAFRRALTNILDNARRHAGHVVLSAARSGARLVQVTVDDDGPGIPPDRRESAFRPFASSLEGGTGLGLTIARDIVRAHGGDIVLEDSPLGGLRARIMLPV